MGKPEDEPYGICIRSLQNPTCVTSCVPIGLNDAGRRQLLISQYDRLLLFGECNGEVIPMQSVSLYQGIEHIIDLHHPITKEELALLVCEDDTVCSVRCVEGNLRRADENRLSLFLESCQNNGQLRRPERITASQAVAVSGTAAVCALALYETILHLVVAHGKIDGSLELELRPLEVDLRATPGRGAYRGATRDATMVLALAFLPLPQGRMPDGCQLLVVISATEAGGARAIHIHCIAVYLDCGRSLPGPWLIRDAHPTTKLLAAVPANPGARAGGVLVISAVRVRLMAERDAVPVCECPLELLGLPLAATQICSGEKGSRLPLLWAVSDEGGGMHLLQLSPGDCTLSARRLVCPVPLSVADTLAFLPGCCPSDQSSAGVLFLGGYSGAGQLVGLPRELLEPWRGTGTPDAAQEAPCHMVSNQFLPNSGPIHDAQLVEDIPGSGENKLLVCSGLAPQGYLRVGLWGLSLQTTISGPTVQACSGLLAAKWSWEEGQHSLLAFSYCWPLAPVSCRWRGPTSPPSSSQTLARLRETLLFVGAPGGWLIQVTPQEVRVVRGRPVGASPCVWKTPGQPISRAFLHAATLAVACGTTLYILALDPATGKLWEAHFRTFPHQISALALAPVGAECLWLAVGLWETHEVQLMPLQSLEQVQGLAGSLRALPRSLAWLVLGSRLFLVAGTADGEAIIFAYDTGPSGGLKLAGCGRTIVGLGSVSLQLLYGKDGDTSGILAVADQTLLIRPAAGFAVGDGTLDCLEAVRVADFEKVLSYVPLHTQALPGSIAWAGKDGRLYFGSIDTQPKCGGEVLGWRKPQLRQCTMRKAVQSLCAATP
eukprot:jgi/Botrbrau1/20128/Bobra.0173s0030.1